MWVASLSLADFRSYERADVAFGPGVSVLLGHNGQGKTNLLEALRYIAVLGSHRVGTDAPLVRAGAERAVVRAEIERDGRRLLAEVEIVPGRANRAKLNRSPLPRPRELLGALRTVLFAPEDLALVKGDPGERRGYLDELMVAMAPRYAGVRADYERVLKQRNTLLRTAAMARRTAGRSATLPTLDVWEEHLARHGGELLAGRLRLVEALRPLVDKAYAAVSEGRGPVELSYRSTLFADSNAAERRSSSELADMLLTELRRVRSEELERGTTLVGPHRDELLLTIGQLPARGYASQGEAWSLALALRLASYDLLREGDGAGSGLGGGEPVLLLDDVFAELDARRRDRLAELVGTAEQVLVTAAVADDVPAGLQQRGRMFHVEHGRVAPLGQEVGSG